MPKYRAGRNIGLQIYREIEKEERHKRSLSDIQDKAESRPESVQAEGPNGTYWLSPIESQLFEEMRKAGLSPHLQYCIQGYFVDFAFPDEQIAVEADGAAYHSGDKHEHDRDRDFHLRQAGWKVMHFTGSTIHNKPGNCAFVIKREVEARRKELRDLERQSEVDRERRNEALVAPLRKVASLFSRGKT